MFNSKANKDKCPYCGKTFIYRDSSVEYSLDKAESKTEKSDLEFGCKHCGRIVAIKQLNKKVS